MPNKNLAFIENATTEYADALAQEQFINFNIKALWQGMPRIAGPAFTVQMKAGDNLMLHSAIYEAPAGSILVVDAGSDIRSAVAGGNVCAIAQKRGIVGMIIDGVIRDIAEIREAKFPVYALGNVAKPGVKKFISPLNQPIVCGSVTVNPNDIIVADEEGIAVIPHAQQQEAFDIASKRTTLDKATSLEDWEKAHRAKILKLLPK